MNYYAYALDDFKREKPRWEFIAFNSIKEQNTFFAEDLVRRIQENEKKDLPFVIVLPVGSIDYAPLIELSNTKNIPLKNLVIFFMDEYCNPDGSYIDFNHPLSFRRFIDKKFYRLLKNGNRMPADHIIFPDGKNPEKTVSKIEYFGGIEITYGGFGINGHLAFNDPPENDAEKTDEHVRNSTVRVVRLARETIIQNAIGGTGGNVEIIPRYAVTLGMKELLSSKEIHLYLIRTWHSGIMRRALFGPVSPDCPGSYVQLHDNVRVCMTPEPLNLPVVNVTLNVGK